MTTEDYYKIEPDEDGWRILPSGQRVKLGRGILLVNGPIEVYDNVTIGNDCVIFKKAQIGAGAILGNYVRIGAEVSIGQGVHIGHFSRIGNFSIIDNFSGIGDGVTIGPNIKIGDWSSIRPYQTTEELNKYFISTYPKKSVFWKWVTKDFMSPVEGNKKPIKYEIGSTIEEPNAIISDQQCDVGLHIFRPGIRPEFVGLCDADTTKTLICLEVEVNREDICFGGLPGNSDKLRVKKLKVLGIV